MSIRNQIMLAILENTSMTGAEIETKLNLPKDKVMQPIYQLKHEKLLKTVMDDETKKPLYSLTHEGRAKAQSLQPASTEETKVQVQNEPVQITASSSNQEVADFLQADNATTETPPEPAKESNIAIEQEQIEVPVFVKDQLSTVHQASKVGQKHPHYHKDVSRLETIDVYRVLSLFNVTHPCLQHAVKKILVAGGRGAGKDVSKDIQESIDSLTRWQEMAIEDGLELNA